MNYADTVSDYLSYHDFDGVEVILEQDWNEAIKPDTTHVTSLQNCH